MDAIEQLIEQLERDLTTMTGAQAAATQGLIDSLKRSQRSFGFFDRYIRQASDSAEDFAEYVDEGGESANVFSDVLRESSRREKDRVKQMATAASNFVQGTLSNIERLGQGSSESSSALTSAAELGSKAFSIAMDSIKGIAGAIAPGIGSAIVGIFTTTMDHIVQAGSAFVGFYAGQMEGLRNQQRQFYESGVQFSNGIDEAIGLVTDSVDGAYNTLTLGNLANAAQMANESLRLMAGGSSQALKNITKSFHNFNKQQISNMYSLGYTNEEILAGMADYAADAERFGQQLSMQELTDGSYAYLKNLRELERLTGVDAKARKSQTDRMREDMAIQYALDKFPVEQRRAMMEIIGSANEMIPGMGRIVAAEIAGIDLADPAAVMFKQNAPSIVKGFVDAVLTGDVEKGNKMLSAAAESSAAELKNVREKYGQLAFYSDKLPGSFAEMLEMSGKASVAADGMAQAAESAGIDLSNMNGPMQQSVNDFVIISGQISNELQRMSFSVTEYVSPAMKILTGSISGLINTINESSEKVALTGEMARRAEQLGLEGMAAIGLQKGEGPYGGVNMIVTEQLKAEAENLGISINELVSKKIEDLITKQKKLQEETLFNTAKSIIEMYGSNELSPVDSEAIKNAATPEIRKRLLQQQQIYEQLDALSNAKLEEYGLTGGSILEDTIGTETFKKLPGRRQGAIVPKNPPIGVIQRMSEAGDEAIMPLSKASGGDLGVKVTGGLIDSSTLMKTLLDVTKGQASLIAGLNSQMANMNSNFEKLVYEQRQANRLAV